MADDERERLAWWITQAREERGLSRHELADRLGVAYTTVYMWEKGEKAPSLLMLGPLCRALEVPAQLFADLPDKPPSALEQVLAPAAARAVARVVRRSGP